MGLGQFQPFFSAVRLVGQQRDEVFSTQKNGYFLRSSEKNDYFLQLEERSCFEVVGKVVFSPSFVWQSGRKNNPPSSRDEAEAFSAKLKIFESLKISMSSVLVLGVLVTAACVFAWKWDKRQ